MLLIPHLVSWLTFVGLPQGTIQFGTPSLYVTDSGASAPATTDIDGDGKLDLLVANYFAGTVSVLLGSGAGVFGPPTNYASGAGTHWIAIGDLNSDGTDDAVSVNHIEGTLSVFLGLPAGSLIPMSPIVVDAKPWDVGIADLNLDGALDAVLSSFGAHTISVLIGNSGGQLGPPVPYSTQIKPSGITVGDMDANGQLDVLVANFGSGSVSVFSGSGGGVLGAPSHHPIASTPIDIEAADLNGDGTLDAAVIGQSPASLFALSGGTSGFIDLASYPQSYGEDVRLADFDGDSTLDVVVGDYPGGGVTIRAGGADGTFGPLSTLSAASGAHAIDVADVDRDGRPDVIVAATGTNSVAILLNETPFVGTPPGTQTYGTGTPGCGGPVALSANSIPKIGNRHFRLTCSNPAPLTTGLWLASDAQDLAGSDPFGIGAILHVGILTATELIPIESPAPASGPAILPLPIPNSPSLVGRTYYIQTIWAWPLSACFLFPFGISTSNGLAITIQP